MATAAIDAAYAVNDAARREFVRLVGERVDRLKSEQVRSLGAVAIALLFVAYLFSRSGERCCRRLLRSATVPARCLR